MSFEKVKQIAPRFDAPPVHTPCDKLPDGPVLGNGDIGVAVSASPEEGKIRFHLGKNDLWNSYSHWETPGIRAYGTLELTLPQARGRYRAAQYLADASVSVTLEGEEASAEVSTWVLRKTGLMVQRMVCVKGNVEIGVGLTHTNREDEAEAGVSLKDGAIHGYKYWAGPLQQWPCKAYSVTKLLGSPKLQAGQQVWLVTSLHTNLESECFQAVCENDIAELDEEKLSCILHRHKAWWKDFWEESSISIPSQPLLERYWYLSHYLMACCCEEGKFAPGLFGNFVTTDTPAWCGDYHLNYNYEAPWWGLYSSNHIGITEPYDQPLLDYMPAAKKAAREKLHCRGLYTLVGIGPKGLRTAALTDREGNDDVNYWGQKSNAAYGAVNMLMRFYATYDTRYGRETAYPYLLETARFWQDYLRWDGKRYVVEKDCIHENQAAAIGVFDWADENTPDDGNHRNPLITLGLLRMLFRGLLDICRECGIDAPEIPEWEHILTHLSGFPTMEREGKTVFRYTENATDWNSEGNSLGIQHIYPAGCVGLGSPPELLEIGRETFRQLNRWEDYNGFPTYFPAGARLGIQPEVLLSHLKEQVEKHGYENGLIFFGGGGMECCSGVPGTLNEMMMQSHEGVIRIFPVWNREWDAEFSCLRAYGAFLVSASLKGGVLGTVTILSEKGRDCTVALPDPRRDWHVTCNNVIIPARMEDGVLRFATQPGKKYEITC